MRVPYSISKEFDCPHCKRSGKFTIKTDFMTVLEMNVKIICRCHFCGFEKVFEYKEIFEENF